MGRGDSTRRKAACRCGVLDLTMPRLHTLGKGWFFREDEGRVLIAACRLLAISIYLDSACSSRPGFPCWFGCEIAGRVEVE